MYGFLTIDDDAIYDVVQHPYFQRLRNIKQLGYTYMVYPGATHTRFGHMLGALSLMNRALEVLKVKGVPIAPDEAQAVKLAILLHDIGHGPFSHTLEYMLIDMPHERCSELFMERLNRDLYGRLTEAISIFNDSYPKHFLHQLVSSQLDMDRLDYLSRDSFFSGVSEGIVGTERIINMLNVCHDELVIDEKGVYSIEKFIISRRLMYWQVYLHKTVVAADMLLLNAMRRAKELLAAGIMLPGSETLLFFLSHHFTEADFVQQPALLDRFALLDDSDVTVTLKSWMSCNDKVLQQLASQLVNRRLPAVRVSEQPFEEALLEQYRSQSRQLYALTEEESRYFVNTGVHENHAYDFNDREIRVLFKDGQVKDISEASDQLDRRFLEKVVKKYYIYFPKELK